MSHVACGLPCWSVIPSRDESRTDFYIPGCHMWFADSLVGVLYPAEMKVDRLLYPGMSHVTCGLPVIPSRDESKTNFYIPGCHMWLVDSLVGVLYPAEMKVDWLLYPGMSHVTCYSLVGVLYPAEMKVEPISISRDVTCDLRTPLLECYTQQRWK
jgi:hypothetical protein